MRPALRRIGRAQNPVVIVDDFSGAVDEVVAMAAAMAPFPAAAGNYYPGLRQPIVPGDAANLYVERTLREAAPFIGGGFDVDTFDLLEASFSIVATPPENLTPAQRAPHFDTTDPNYIAVLHYLSDTPGTAFFRQRATEIETVDERNVAAFVAAARQANDTHGYIHRSDPHYEEIGRVEGVRDRLAIYRGAMLHSGIIPPDAIFSDDPRRGRLTANIFIRARKD